MIEKSIYSMLASDSAVTALASGKIYPVVLPQNYGVPAVVYRNNGIDKLSNYDTTSEEFTKTSIAVDAVSDSYTEMKELSKAVFDALHNYRGTQSGNIIYSIEHDSYLELYDDGLELYRASRIFLINHLD